MNKALLKIPAHHTISFLFVFNFIGAIFYYAICAAAVVFTAILGVIAFPFYAVQRLQQKLKKDEFGEKEDINNLKLHIAK